MPLKVQVTFNKVPSVALTEALKLNPGFAYFLEFALVVGAIILGFALSTIMLRGLLVLDNPRESLKNIVILYSCSLFKLVFQTKYHKSFALLIVNLLLLKFIRETLTVLSASVMFTVTLNKPLMKELFVEGLLHLLKSGGWPAVMLKMVSLELKPLLSLK